MIKIQGLHKKFGAAVALQPTSLAIRAGEMIALLGASGSGKTTLLRLIAGLERASGGQIWLQGREVSGLGVQERQLGFVFQNYALFKHLTVAENIAFGLDILPRRRRPSRGAIAARVEHLLEQIQMSALADRYPAQLSGGQQQRVALARALATEPAVVLFDEPFGALDISVRRDLRQWLKRLQRQLGFTGIFVSHDREEALELADRIVLMRGGAIEQAAPAAELFAQPANGWVFHFMSDSLRFPAEIARQVLHCGAAFAKCEWPRAAGPGELAIRLEDLAFSKHALGSMQFPVRIEEIEPLGANYRLRVRALHWADEGSFSFNLPSQSLASQPLSAGERCYLRPYQLFFIRPEGAVEALLNPLLRG